MKQLTSALFAITLTHLLALPLQAEDRLFVPGLTVSEEYTDNVDDTKINKRSEYITRLQPGFSSRYEAKRLTWDAVYAFDYRYYARNRKDNDHSHLATAKSSLQLLENFLYLDLTDSYKQISKDTLRDQTVSSVSSNQTEQNIAMASPYAVWRLTGKTSLKTGYRFTDTRYWDDTSIDKQSHSGFADLHHELTAKLSLTAGYTFTRQLTNQLDYDKHDATVGFRYNYGEKSFLSASAGHSWQQFSDETKTDYLFWNIALTQDFSPYTITLEAKRQVTEDPLAVSTREDLYTAKLERSFERGSISAYGGYTEHFNLITGLKDQHKHAAGLTVKYEITRGLTADANALAEHYHYYDAAAAGANYPYRLSTTAKLAWQLREQTGLSLAYTRVANQYRIERLSGGWTTNRVIAELKMMF